MVRDYEVAGSNPASPTNKVRRGGVTHLGVSRWGENAGAMSSEPVGDEDGEAVARPSERKRTRAAAEPRQPDERYFFITNRAIAQLVARLHGVQEAVGSSPASPTIFYS